MALIRQIWALRWWMIGLITIGTVFNYLTRAILGVVITQDAFTADTGITAITAAASRSARPRSLWDRPHFCRTRSSPTRPATAKPRLGTARPAMRIRGARIFITEGRRVA